MKKILVPTDFSDTAEHALKIAAQLAKKHNSEIYLLHMLELPMQLIDPVAGGNSQNLPESIFFMKLAHQRFAKLMQRPFLKDIKVHETVMFHQAFDGIMEVSEDYDCDIIIMGSHGASGFKEMFIGSNTEKVVRSSNIPVLVIKNEHGNFEVENFIFATDADGSNKHTLEKAYNFAQLIEAKFHLLFINTPNNFITSTEVRERIENFVSGFNIHDYKMHIYNDVSVEKGILNFAMKQKKALIGISTHGRKGLAHFFNGSISEDLVNHANMPVVTFKI
ncbi:MULTISPECIES: universal stress protein [Salegentibacter]|jgi:nucleotide-binding universal stress UspA family protein|uniref:Nucleotide-binding universal stress protein, UspA family n=2 Tax=Salegentibacter TaxID=143222 RepID=A0A1I2NV96_9FLAO|nr:MULTISPECIES: universal stress protein [Salegentibacter]APS38394.1 universal stress protein UspA [Salegentibacter sp. T436]SFG06789.1 Nucleotide-binding universal stress protein, UspA family [Salegentibacter agarivorans]